MRVAALPPESKILIAACLALQLLAFCRVAQHDSSGMALSLLAFFIGGFMTDLISGVFHFSFDYIWPPETPIMGPIAVEFREHHEEPTLDPSALAGNFTKGSYGALPLAVITLIVDLAWTRGAASYLVTASLMATSLWMLGFHQIHAYAHMGSRIRPDEFNAMVTEIACMPKARQKRELIRLFEGLGIPRPVRWLQRGRIFLRPEIHWQHHISFETDFASVNGWSDPVMNHFYRPFARYLNRRRSVSDSVFS